MRKRGRPGATERSIESAKMGRIFFGILIILGQGLVVAEDPYQYEDWTVSYIDASPLGVTQKVRSASLHLLISTLHSPERTFLTFGVQLESTPTFKCNSTACFVLAFRISNPSSSGESRKTKLNLSVVVTK
jgi:hypothetical protein